MLRSLLGFSRSSCSCFEAKHRKYLISEGDGVFRIPDEINGVAVTSIGINAFQDYYSMTAITIPAGVTSIGRGSFCDCFSLKEISIPAGVTSMGDYVFMGCIGLKAISIHSSLTSFGVGAFWGCSASLQFILRVPLRTLFTYDYNRYNSRMLFFTFDLFCEFLSTRELAAITRVSKCFYSAIVTRCRHDFVFQ